MQRKKPTIRKLILGLDAEAGEGGSGQLSKVVEAKQAEAAQKMLTLSEELKVYVVNQASEVLKTHDDQV